MTPGKIPVFRCVGAGIGFGAGRLLTVLRVSWVSMLVLMVSIGLTVWLDPNMQGVQLPRNSGPNENGLLLGIANFGFLIASLILMVGLTKAYFRESDAAGVFYFKFGSSELRVIAAYFVVFVLFLILSAIVGGITALIGYALLAAQVFSQSDVDALVTALSTSESQGDMAIAGLLVPAMIIWGFVILWASLRVSLILPVIVKEKRVGVFRSWRLMRGNVWRMIGLSFLLSIAVAFVWIPIFGLGAMALYGLDPSLMESDGVDVNFNQFGIDEVLAYWPLAISYVLALLILYAAYIGALARAYEALVAPVTGDDS